MLNIKNGEMNKAYKIKRMDIANEKYVVSSKCLWVNR